MKDSKEEREPWKLAITCRKRLDVASLGNLSTPKHARFPSLYMPGRSATLVIGQAVGSMAKKDQREAAYMYLTRLSYSSTVVLHILVHSGIIFRAPCYFVIFCSFWGPIGFRIRFLFFQRPLRQAKDN